MRVGVRSPEDEQMAKKREEELPELSLTPIMNMVMILIPMLLLAIVFMKTGVINITSPRNTQSNTPDTEQKPEEVMLPQVTISISADGFRLVDAKNVPEFVAKYTPPTPRCGGGGAGGAAAGVAPHDAAKLPATICLREGATPDSRLIEQLDYAALYNHLARIRLEPAWYDEFGKENKSTIQILADPEVPFDVVVKTMDTARYFLRSPEANPGAPSASASVEAFMLAGGNPTQEDLKNAVYLTGGESATERFAMFPDPVLLLPRPTSGG
jgi:biopolymer transport protein ExbD